MRRRRACQDAPCVKQSGIGLRHQTLDLRKDDRNLATQQGRQFPVNPAARRSRLRRITWNVIVHSIKVPFSCVLSFVMSDSRTLR